jgi:hypothetical protein
MVNRTSDDGLSALAAPGSAVPEICLLRDQFEGHKTCEVHKLADSLRIHRVFILKGGDGEILALDRTIFGVLKAKGGVKWAR